MIVESLSRTEIAEGKKYVYYYRIIKEKIMLPIEEWQSACKMEGAQKKKDFIEVQAYGIEIERQDISDTGIVKIERDYLKGISPQRYKVHNLLKMLYTNSVSPLHLANIIEDYVDDYIIDFNDELNLATNSY